MSPEQIFTAVLLENVTPLTGVYPLEVPKGKDPPFILYVQHRAEEDDALDGLTGLCEGMYELNAVGGSYAQMASLADSMVTAVRGMQGNTYQGLSVDQVDIRQESPDLKEKDVGLYRRMYSLRMSYQKEDNT